MTTEELIEKQSNMTDDVLLELVDNELSSLFKTGGKSMTMCVPPRITDTDMLLVELVKRYKKALNP